MRARRAMGAAVCAVLAGCVGGNEDIGRLDSALVCPPWGCRENAASLGDGRVFHDLDLSRTEANSGGVRVVDISGPRGVRPFSLHVDGDRLRGDDGTSIPVWDVVGTTLLLENDRGVDFQVTVVDTHQMRAWDRMGASSHSMQSVQLTVHQVDTDDLVTYPLCKGEELASDPDWAAHPYDALVFAGDVFDADRKTVGERPPGSAWATFACAGTATAKMHLLRHTVAGSVDGFSATIAERQAMLKMLTADYCGDGTAYTQNGQPLDYADDNAAPFSSLDAGEALEAIWSAGGAVCLNHPRLVARADVRCLPKKPIRWCTPDDAQHWRDRGYVVSALRHGPPP
jgi:ADYC domain